MIAPSVFLQQRSSSPLRLVLTDFYGIAANQIGWYILPFAAGNFLGPCCLGRLFDTVGRRVMITVTYGVSGVLLALSGYLFMIGALRRTRPNYCMDGNLFFRFPCRKRCIPNRQRNLSAGGPCARESRWFYAVGTAIGGVVGPRFVRER